MKLFIKVKDGKPVDHPIMAENFAQAFPDIDTENLPSEFARFIRVTPPQINRFEVYEGATYEWNGGAFTDVHHIRPMSEVERAEAIEHIRANPPSAIWVWDEKNIAWLLPKRPTEGGPWKRDLSTYEWVIATEPPFPSWVLSEDGTHYTAPIPKPVEEGKIFRWSGADNNWKEAPARPEGEGQYVFDFAEWAWVSA
jgi:hypothetical protein